MSCGEAKRGDNPLIEAEAEGDYMILDVPKSDIT
jgi:hypothetical protein